MAGTPAVLNLSAPRFQITAEAGNDINFSFLATALNTTGFTFEFIIYDQPDGPGEIILETLTEGDGITNTPGTNSTIAISVAADITADLSGQSKWCELVRTDTGFVRTYAKGNLVLV